MVPTCPFNLNKNNGSEHPNADAKAFSDSSKSASIRYNTLNTQPQLFLENCKNDDCSCSSLSSSNSVQTAYPEIRVSNPSNSFTRIIYT